MTEERVREIAASKLHKLSVSEHAFECAVNAMIFAVNEALEEAANKAEPTFETKHYFGDKSYPTYNELSVYKPSILNLKVK